MTEEKKSLDRGLKNRHVQLIALGGAIGTGLFLGSGRSIQLAGPSILIAYAAVGIMCFLIMRALGELLLSDTSKHSFIDFIAKYLGVKAAFVTGWTYWFCWVSIAMADLTATGTYVRYWFPSVPAWIPEIIILALLIGLNLVAVALFGELEFWFSLIKVIAIIALIVTGVVLMVIGFKTSKGTVSLSNIWSYGGFFPTGADGFLKSFQMATFAFVGIELVGLVAGETKDPETVIPKAINSLPIRVLLFYIGALAVIMSIYPWNSLNADQSPFVEVFADIGVAAAATIVNLVVLSSAASACNSAIYSTGRMLHSLSREGNAPSRYSKLTRHYVPAAAIFFSSAVILIAVILNFFMPSQVFTLITSISTICFLFIWFMIVFAHFKYRRSEKQAAKSKPKAKRKFPMPLFPYTSYLIVAFLAFIVFVLFLQGETRQALFFVPIWFIALLVIFEWKIKPKLK
ncbi:amino acid permease [uncultured Enterococcus sp.]|uniref:amino acid permease n=1 Tax=uncultured Enterococcus sp. TaxID=167972 RepID=UPI0025E169E0|nr:amino acid permease [uncultured Enterococcus sp.]